MIFTSFQSDSSSENSQPLNPTNNFSMSIASENLVFDLPSARPNIIKVIGVGGAGGNAVNHMFQTGIHEVDFLLCNTDYQALERSRVSMRLQLGPNLTAGRGAGNRPEVGREAAIETLDDLRAHLGEDTRMVFITAGLGGGTGTGAAPVIARLCRELDILTVGIVTLPFSFEGKKRLNQATEGLEQLRTQCDTTLVISNDKVREVYGNLAFDQAFARADDVLATAAKGIAEIITIEGHVNVDFSDVNTVLRNSGKAVMGSGLGTGADRAIMAIQEALSSPLLNDNDITGAGSILLNISSGEQTITLDEIGEINDYIQTAAGSDTNIIWGNCTDPQLADAVRVTVIATGFLGGSTESTRRTLVPMAETATEVNSGISVAAASVVPPATQLPEMEAGARLEIREGKQTLVHTLDGQNSQVLGSSMGSMTPSSEAASRAQDILQQPIDSQAESQASAQSAAQTAAPSTSQTSAHPATQPAEPRTLREHLFGDNAPSKALFSFFGSSDKNNGPSTPPVPQPEEMPVVNPEPVPNSKAGSKLKKKTEATQESKSEVRRGASPQSEPEATLPTATTPIPMAHIPQSPISVPPPVARPAHEDVLGRSERRRQTLRGLSFRGHEIAGPGEVRSEPAFMRKGVQLSPVESSDAHPVSRFTLGESPDQRPEIRENNAFLHDNVD